MKATFVMAQFTIENCIQAHHVSKLFWTPIIGETLFCKQEPNNATDPYVVASSFSTHLTSSFSHQTFSSVGEVTFNENEE